MADKTNPMADKTNPMADKTNPMADKTNPMADKTNPMADKKKVNFTEILSEMSFPTLNDDLHAVLYPEDDTGIIRKFFKRIVFSMYTGFNEIDFDDSEILQSLKKGLNHNITGVLLNIDQFVRDDLNLSINRCLIHDKDHYEDRVKTRISTLRGFLYTYTDSLARIFGDVPIKHYDRLLTINCWIQHTPQNNDVIRAYTIRNDYTHNMGYFLSTPILTECIEFQILNNWFVQHQITKFMSENQDFLKVFLSGKTKTDLIDYFTLPTIENTEILRLFIRDKKLNTLRINVSYKETHIGHLSGKETHYSIIFWDDKINVEVQESFI